MFGVTEWSELGWQLFQDKDETRVQFINSDLLAADPLSVSAAGLNPNSTDGCKIRAISAFALFHLFSQERQVRLALTLWNLLDHTPGSIIFGIQKGMANSTQRDVPVSKEGQDVYFW